jgi:hypothetical protein
MFKKAESKVLWLYFVVTFNRFDLKCACVCVSVFLQYSASDFVLLNIVQNSHYVLNV